MINKDKTTQAQEKAAVEGKNITVLLLEDDPDIIHFIGEITGRAESNRITIERMSSLSEGLARLSGGDIDVILLDLSLPGINAPLAFDTITTQFPHIPVVIMTDQEEESTAFASASAAAHDILKKADMTTGRLIGVIRSAAELKQAREEIQQSTEKFRALFGAIPIPTYLWKYENEDFILIDYNSAALTITEGNIPNLLGQSVSRMYSDFPELIDDMHRCYRERVTINKEILYHFQTTGRDRYQEVTYGFMPPDLILVYTVDITERKEALTESEQKYRLLVENSSEGIVVVQQDRVAYANPRAIMATGYSPEELTACNFMDFVHPDDRERVLEYHAKGMAGQNPPPISYRIVTHDGNVIWTEVNGSLIEWDGQQSGLLFYKDVTDQIKAQEALRESEEKYRLVVENANEGIIVSQSTHLKFVNPKVVKELGYTEDELASRPFIELIHPDDREMVMQHHLDGISGKDVAPTISYRIFDRNGTMRWVEVTGVRIAWEGQPCALLFVKDISDRKRTEKTLQESEEKYRHVVENASEGIVIVQRDSIKYVNSKFTDMIGYSHAELTAHQFLEFIDPDDREKVRDFHARGIAGEAPPPITYRIIDKSGNIHWIEVSGVLIVWEGEPSGLLFMKDVTDRLLAQEALRKSEERYRDLIENTGDFVYVMDGSGKFRLINQTIEREYGYTASELLGKGFTDIITPESYKLAIDVFKKQLIGIDVGSVEYDIYDRNGEIKTIETKERLLWEGDRVVEINGIARDVTDRKRTETALRESEDKYRSLVENLNDAICTTDLEGRVTYVSPVVEQVTGYTTQEIIGRPIMDFIYPEDRPLFSESYKKTLSGQKEPLEFRAVRKDGNIIHVRTFSRRQYHNGVLLGLTGTITDITERVTAENARRESEEKYRLVVENAEEIITIAVGDHLIFANRKALELSGYSREEALALPVTEMIHPDDRQMVLEQRKKRSEGETEPQFFTMRFLKKDGRTVWLQNSVVPVIWEGKRAALNVATDITEQKQIEDALRESEEKYRLVVQNAGEGIAIAHGGVTRFVNPIITRLLGYTSEEITSRPFIEFLHPDDRQMALDHHIKRTTLQEKPDVYLFRAVSKTGDIIWFENNGVLITWEGRPATLNFLRDITEQRKTEIALKESEEKYRMVVENANEIIIISQNGIIQFANDRIKDLFGCRAQDVLSKHLSDIVIKKDRERLREEYQRLVSGKETMPAYQYRATDIQGNIRNIEVSGIHITWEGQPAILSFVTDVTERVKAEKALQESEAFTRGLVEHAPLGILYLDKEGTITYENPKSWMITAGDFDETRPSRAIGMSIYDLPGILDYPESKTVIDTILSGRSVTNYTLPFTSLTGKQTILNVYGAPRTSSDGVQIGSVILISDITEKVRSDEEIKQRLHYEEAVAFCSRELVSFSNLEETLQNIVEQLRIVVGFGCVFVCRNFIDPVEGLSMKTINEAVVEPRKSAFKSPKPLAYKYLSKDLWDALNSGRWFGGPTKDHPPVEREILKILGCLSSIRIPIFVDGLFWGLMGFDDYETERIWDEQDILLLQTISSMIGTAIARNEAQAALTQSEQRYRELVDNTSDLITMSDYRGNFKFVNDAVRQLGYEPEEVIGRNIYEFYAPSSKKYAQELFRLQKTGARLTGYELDIVRKDGQIRTIEFRDDLKWEGDRIIEIQSVGRDVTDRKKREDRLRLVAGSQEAVLNSLPEMVFFTDMALKITWTNVAASRLTGFPIEELVGRFCYEVLHHRKAPCEGCPTLIALITGRPEKKTSMPCLGRNRRVTAYPVSDISGSVTGIAVSVGSSKSRHSLDISESFSSLDDDIEQDDASGLFLAPLDPNYIYPFSLSIDIQKDTFSITLRWDEYSKEHLLKRLTRSESAVARFIYLAARMKTDGTGWVDKDIIRAGTMDTNLNKLRSLLEESNVPFLDRFSSRMLIRSNREEKKKVRLALSASNIEISPSIKNFRSKKHRYMAAISKKIKTLKQEIEKANQPKEYLISELSIQRRNEANLRKSIEVVETLIGESAILLKY
ncbi:MAG: PAS domain S-box protein [Deltaproteobacteria bacterium]|nr:PAS domain S-box protein [Candidatus Zymogenaceae bacterium]